MYLETAQRLKAQRQSDSKDTSPEVQELDFEFVLFASDVIDYDYIMKLIAKYSQTAPSKQSMSRQQLIGLIASDAKFMGERADIEAYINTLKEGEGLSEKQIRDGFEKFKAEKQGQELATIAQNHGLDIAALDAFVETILGRMIFDDEKLTDLLAPLGLGWKARTHKKLEIMEDLIPLLNKKASGRKISGLNAYEQ